LYSCKNWRRWRNGGSLQREPKQIAGEKGKQGEIAEERGPLKIMSQSIPSDREVFLLLLIRDNRGEKWREGTELERKKEGRRDKGMHRRGKTKSWVRGERDETIPKRARFRDRGGGKGGNGRGGCPKKANFFRNSEKKNPKRSVGLVNIKRITYKIVEAWEEEGKSEGKIKEEKILPPEGKDTSR